MSTPVLLDYQRRWISDPAPVAICEKSRRVGITWATSAQSVLTAAAKDGMDCWYCGISKDMAAEFIRDTAEWARNLGIAASAIQEDIFPDGDDGSKSIQGFKVSFASGFRVSALSSRPSSLRGKQGLIIGDESAFHPDLPGLMKAAVAMLIWGGRVRLISTHFGVENYFNQLIEDARAGKNPYSVHRVTIDDALRDGLFKRICEVSGQLWTPDKEAQWRQELFDFYGSDADEELNVIPASGSGSYISRIAIEQCMVEGRPLIRLALSDDFLHQSEAQREAFISGWIDDELRELLNALPPHAKHVLGQDFGRSGDLSAIAPASEGDDLTYHVPFLLEMRNVPFESQRQILFAICDRLPHFTRASLDASGNGSWLAETAQQRYYGKVDAIKFTEQFYTSHMPQLRDALENRRLTLPRHADILRDVRQIELIRGIPKIDANKRQTGSDGKIRHADTAIALLLAWYAASEGGVPAGGSIVTRQSAHYRPLHGSGFGLLR